MYYLGVKDGGLVLFFLFYSVNLLIVKDVV